MLIKNVEGTMKQKWRVYDIRTKIYTFTVRTVDSQLAKYFSDVLKNHYTQKMISEIFSLSPVITKSNEGYWRSHMSLDEYENRLFSNAVKKYNYFTGEQIEENFPLYTRLQFLNRHPIVCRYKNISLLGERQDWMSMKRVNFLLL